MTTPVNLNAKVRVILTENGAAIYNKWAGDLNQSLPPKCAIPYMKAADLLETELWSLMQKFGPGIYNGMPGGTPFLDNELEILK